MSRPLLLPRRGRDKGFAAPCRGSNPGKSMRDEYREKFRVLGLKIAYYRKLRGLTQEQLAEAIGRSVSFVSQVEANNSPNVKGVSLETLFMIAERLNIPASKLFED